jgi:hypothetical protein
MNYVFVSTMVYTILFNSHFSNSLLVFCNISELILKMRNGIRVLEKSWAWFVFC